MEKNYLGKDLSKEHLSLVETEILASNLKDIERRMNSTHHYSKLDIFVTLITVGMPLCLILYAIIADFF